MNKEIYRIGLVDDDALVVALLSSHFEQFDEFEIIISANDGDEFLNKMSSNDIIPHLLILDLNMKKMDGLSVLENIKKEYPAIKVVILSSYYQLGLTGFMLKAGVDAFQPKGILPDQLVDIVRNVIQLGHYFSIEQLSVIRKMMPEKKGKSPKPYLADLTERELEIIELICQQKTAQEIGDQLHIAKRTVEGHKNNILLKTGVKNTAGLVIYAIKNNIVNPEIIFS